MRRMRSASDCRADETTFRASVTVVAWSFGRCGMVFRPGHWADRRSPWRPLNANRETCGRCRVRGRETRAQHGVGRPAHNTGSGDPRTTSLTTHARGPRCARPTLRVSPPYGSAHPIPTASRSARSRASSRRCRFAAGGRSASWTNGASPSSARSSRASDPSQTAL
jgi:hypothetical protein